MSLYFGDEIKVILLYCRIYSDTAGNNSQCCQSAPFLVFLTVCLKKSGECAEIAKKLKVRHKKCALFSLLHLKVIYLPGSIFSEKREHLSRTPPKFACELLLPLLLQCWQLLQFVCLQGDTCVPCQDTSNFRSFLYSFIFLRYLFSSISFWQKFRFGFKLVQTCMFL